MKTSSSEILKKLNNKCLICKKQLISRQNNIFDGNSFECRANNIRGHQFIIFMDEDNYVRKILLDDYKNLVCTDYDPSIEIWGISAQMSFNIEIKIDIYTFINQKNILKKIENFNLFL